MLNQKNLTIGPGVEAFDDSIEPKVHIFSPSRKLTKTSDWKLLIRNGEINEEFGF